MQVLIIFNIAKLYSLEFLAYPLETTAIIVRRAFEIGLLVFFWYLISQETDITSLQILPYILISSGVLYLVVGNNFPQGSLIAKDIKFGRLNSILVRPVSELSYELGAYLGKNVFLIGFSALNIVIGLMLIDNGSLLKIILFTLSLVPAFVIGYSLNVLVAASAFWVIETGNFRLISYFIIRIVSGMFIPLTLFSGIAGVVLPLLPFAQLAFVPGFILTSDNLLKSVLLLSVGFVEALLMFWLARAAWAKGLRRYGAVGI